MYSAGTRVTAWNYDAYRGFLTNKAYAGSNGPSYTYTSAGRLASRAWARGTDTTYSYNTVGNLLGVVYSDGTPGVTNNYDRLGRKSSVVCGATSTSFVYDLANDVLSESYSNGILGGLTVTNQFDPDLRRTNMVLWNGAALVRAIYGYDNASRLASV
ncbi:MAG TPA: hypothetical protein VMQ67_08895, partial [Candidatus Saccharimonadales bacterium]|nr:hypothetical protein [Candidatus Saccharimonadales bacterium]